MNFNKKNLPNKVVITWTLVGIQCVIVAVAVMEEMPDAGFDPRFQPRRMVLVCPSSNMGKLLLKISKKIF
jgi:hypothetical protein